jgi:hypothetical protein
MVMVIALLIGGTASIGEHAISFQVCLTRCQPSCTTLSPILRWFQWDCLADCKYSCMWEDVRFRQETGLPIVQYYGKWPFVRVLGMQELASVVFSLLNLLMHVIGWKQYMRTVPSTYPLKKWVTGYTFVNINVWVWSSVFHSRDTPITEKLDYFGALLVSVYSCFLAQIRVVCPQVLVYQCLMLLPFLTGTLYYIGYYMWRTLNYELNMEIHVALSLLTITFWSYSAYVHRQAHAKIMFICFILISMFVLLELGDFWHLSTATIVIFWYRFLTADALYCHSNNFESIEWKE